MSQEEQESWAIVSLMGHKTLAGRLSEEERFGSKMGRLDVPDGENFATVYFGGSSVYSIEVVTEDVARVKAAEHKLRPVYTYRIPEGEQLERPVKQIGHRDSDTGDFGDDFTDEDEDTRL